MNRKLKAKIVEKFGTQADFSQEIKIDETLVSKVVRGRRQLSDESKKIWAKVLDCKPEELFLS